jgi:uncharacterized membrane protein (DUF485 family)
MTSPDGASLLDDPRFRQLLRRRGRLRWSLAGLLTAAYLAYSVAGVYASDLLGRNFMDSPVSWWIVIGYVLIVLSIALSLVYVRATRNLYASYRLGVSEVQR